MRVNTAVGLSGVLLAQGSPHVENLPSFYMTSGAGGSGHSTGGHAWYQRQFSLIQYDDEYDGKTIKTDFGMSGSWLQPYGANYPSNPCQKDGMRECDFTTFEGGSSYSESVFGRQPKWKVGDSVGCYRAYTQSNMFHTHEAKPHACSYEHSGEPKRTMGLAQLSNRLLLFPDGQSFEKEGMIGVSYARTPFGKNNASDDRNYWTLIFESENYAGPVAYFVPEFWKLRSVADEEVTKDFTDFSDTPEIQMTSPAWECHAMPNLVDGNVHKLIKMSVPQVKGRSVLWMGQRAHEDSELMDPLEEALATGKLDPTVLMRDGHAVTNCQRQSAAKFGDVAEWATSNNVIEDGDCLWTLKVANSTCPNNGMCDVPQFYKSGSPVDPSQASSALRAALFPTNGLTTNFKYDALSVAPSGGCRDSPGPADHSLYCAQSVDDTWIGYRWYRFVDQPALAQQKLSAKQKTFMQQRVEALHRMTPSPVNKWINGRNAEAEGMARMDPAAIASPPRGLEVGHVPIILYQGLAKPSECVAAPTPPPTPSTNTNGIWIYELGGSGKAFLDESRFTANSHRGGALAWDACSGTRFDNGREVWASAGGSRIGAVAASGMWAFRSASACALSWNYGDFKLSNEFAAADGRLSASGITYLEVQPSGVWIYESGGTGKTFLGEGSFAANAHRGGALSWDVCAGATFDNGHPVWKSAEGTKIGAVQAAGGWSLRWSTNCAATYYYPSLSISDVFTSADGKKSIHGLGYLELSATSILI